MICRARRNTVKKSQDSVDTYEAGFYPEIKINKTESDPTTDGVYNWLDGLQQSHNTRKLITKEQTPGLGLDLCYEEGSSCSRPTTSTDDSLSNEEADYVNSKQQHHNNNNMSGEMPHMHHSAGADMQHTAALQLSRSRQYRESVKYSEQLRYQAQANPHRYTGHTGHAPGQPGHPGYRVSVAHPGVRKQRHESVV